MNIRTIVATSLLLFATPMCGKAFGASLFDRVTGAVGQKVFQLDLTEETNTATGVAKERPRGFPRRQVKVRCLVGCNSIADYTETLDDAPISAFRIDDEGRDFITIWETGTAYIVRIYRVADGPSRKVFEEYSKTFPQFISVREGGMTIVLNGSGGELLELREKGLETFGI